MNQIFKLRLLCSVIFCLLINPSFAQPNWDGGTYWSADGNKIMRVQGGSIVQEDALNPSKTAVLISKEMLTPSGKEPLDVVRFSFSIGNQKILINTNTKKVWRYDTRGDFWVYDLQTKTLKQVGKDKPASSLMFAKFSPDASKVAYVSGHNIYVEDLISGSTKTLTTDGTLRLINGTFDWVYEEELNCRDGF